MTEAPKLLSGSAQEFAVIRSTLSDSKVTHKLLGVRMEREVERNRLGWTQQPSNECKICTSKYSKALLGEARRIDHTLDTLAKIKADYDYMFNDLVERIAALESSV